MQITQECQKYDLTTNSLKFIQQTTSISSEAGSSIIFVTNIYCSTPT